MAYLTVRLSAGAYNPATNSTSVSATVSITWDTSESYNQEHGTGTLTIGSYSTTFSTDFNASRTERGTQTLGGGSTTISHNSNGDPVRVTASASGAGRSASSSITLPGLSSESGDGSTDDPFDNTGGGTTNYTDIILNAGKHTRIKIIITDADERHDVDGQIITESCILADVTQFQIFYEVDDGYVIDEHTIYPKAGSSDTTFYNGYASNTSYRIYTITTTAKKVIKPCINIPDGPGYPLYKCHINNGSNWNNAYAPYISVKKLDSSTGQNVIEWVPCEYLENPKATKYLYKDGTSYISGNFRFSCYNSSVYTYFGTTIEYKALENNDSNITICSIISEISSENQDMVDIRGFKYLCVKVGELSVRVDTEKRTDENFYIGFSTMSGILSLHRAMCLTPSDSNGSYYVDLTSVDLVSNYYIGFGTAKVSNDTYFNIQRIWLSNEIDSSLTKKSFNYVMTSSGLTTC